MRLTRKNEAGQKIPDTYYTLDYKYMVERGVTGWKVYRIDRKYGRVYSYSFSADTLKEVKEKLIFRRAI